MIKEGMFLQGRYEIINKIGTGGMADVYKAKDHKLNRFVAIKILKEEFREDSDFISKFRQEAQAAAGLAHPNIVNIYDVGEERGMHFIVMELVEGITLKEYIMKKGRLAVREATSIAIQVSQGLEAAHNSGIIHRDVKPQNVIISTDGKVKVTDFGIARVATSNTISTSVMGSVHYTSPEQARGGYSDAKGDIYSLGISMYEMLTGHLPFDGDSTVAVAIKHLQEEMKAPDVYVPDLPKSTIQIINKCTQKSPDRRYANMAELIRDLKESLIHPDGDFVRPAGTQVAGSKTIVISKDELGVIKESYQRGRSQETSTKTHVFNANNPYNTPDGQPEEDGKKNYDPYARGIDISAYGKYGYKEEISELSADTEEDEEDDEDTGFLSPRLEKLMTVGSIVIGILIAVIFLGLIANAFGLFKFTVGGIRIPNVITDIIDRHPEPDKETNRRESERTTEQQTNRQSEQTTQNQPDLPVIPDNGGQEGFQGDYIDIVETEILNGYEEEEPEEPLENDVPDVTGLDYYSGVDQLMTAGFYVTRQDEESTIFPEGSIIEQSIIGKARPGQTIILTVSTGAPRRSGLWSCDVRLTAPGDYDNEPVRLILEHGNTMVTLIDGESVDFPYDLTYSDTEEAATGTVYMYVYDYMMEDYVLNVSYESVPFEQE